MVGIVAYGAYVPRLRLQRQAVYDANKWFAAGLRGLAKGERSMANWDEDSITMAVEASRDCLTSHEATDVRSLYFASTTHPFKDRQNAGVIGTALSIEQNLLASDVGGSLKAGTSALIAGLNASKNGGGPALVAASDKRMARVASSNELNYGDGAAALLCGTENVIAKLVGHHSVSMDFVDHFRGDESDFDYGWEERWIRDEGYSKIVPPAIKAGARRLQAQGQRHHPLHHAEPDAGRAEADGQDLRHRRGRRARSSGRDAGRHRLRARAGHAGRCAGDRQGRRQDHGRGVRPGRRHPGVRGHGRERQAAQAQGPVGMDGSGARKRRTT